MAKTKEKEVIELDGKAPGRVPPKDFGHINPVNFVPHGSPQQAAMMGIREADEDDFIKYRGMTLVDITICGEQASKAYIMTVLKQKVNSWMSLVPLPQSKNPRAPFYAPVMWEPEKQSQTPGMPTAEQIQQAMEVLRLVKAAA